MEEMKVVVVYTKTFNPEKIMNSTTHIGFIPTASRHEMIEKIVTGKNICGLVIEPGKDADPSFLESLTECFPRLNCCIITDADFSKNKNNRFISVISRFGRDINQINTDIGAFLNNLRVCENRKAHRYSWPLRGFFTREGKSSNEHYIHALSSHGAFLESAFDIPAPESKGRLAIHFRNVDILLDCEVMDRRAPASNLPGGFGVKFINPPQKIAGGIQKIVNDRLVQVLLDPENEPEAPELWEPEFIDEDFEIL